MCVCVCASLFRLRSKQLTALYHDNYKDGIFRGRSLAIISLCHTSHCASCMYCTVLYIAVQMALCRTYHRYSVDGIAATTERYYNMQCIQHDLNVINLLLLLLLCRPPVIYVGDSGLPMDCLHVCTRVCGDYTLTGASVYCVYMFILQLGLPLSTVSVGKCSLRHALVFCTSRGK